ncbi:MAG: FAD-binding oxidoreductase [Myxococcota bacterium]
MHEPAGIIQPGSETEVAEVVRILGEACEPVVPYGAGSGVCGGTTPDRGGFVVDVKRLRGITALDSEALTVRVGAGTIGMDLETELQRRGFTLGHYPSSLYCSSVGGYLAARSAGQQSSLFGKIEDMVQSLRLVTGTGELLDTGPGLGVDAWPGGLDMTQLVVGSEGTLGIITSSTLRIHPAPEVQLYRGFQCPTLEEGLQVQRRLMQAGLRPCVMRLYDEFDSLIAGRGDDAAAEPGLPSRLVSGLREVALEAVRERADEVGWLKELWPDVTRRVSRAARGLLGRAIGQPLLLNQLVDALPGGCLLVLGFEGPERETLREAQAGFAIARQHGFDLGPGPGEHWHANRFNVSYKQSPLFDMGAFVDTMEVSTTWSSLTHMYYAVKEAVAPHAFIMAHFSHAYPEGASIYFTFAGFGSDTEESLARYEAAWQAGQEAVMASGGSVAHHHGVGLSKAPRIGHDHQGGRVLFEGLKAAFDPQGIMNPGKVWVLEEGGGA